MSDVGFRVYEPNGVVAVGTNTQGVWPIATLTVKDEYLARVAWGEVLYGYESYGQWYDYAFPRLSSSYTKEILRRTCTLDSTDGEFDSASTEVSVPPPNTYYGFTPDHLISFGSKEVPEVSVKLPTPVQYSQVFVLPIPTADDVAVLPKISANSDSSKLLIKDSPQIAGSLPTYAADPRPVQIWDFFNNTRNNGCNVVATGAYGLPTDADYYSNECYTTWHGTADVSKAGQIIWEQADFVYESKFYILGKAT
jgi:hypothetical protein